MANNITLNCIVILNNPRNQLSANIVSLIIMIPRNETVDDLQTAIQNKLGSNIPLDIRQICHPGPVDERQNNPHLVTANHWDNECDKPKTDFGKARIIQRAWRNYKNRPESLATRVWEAVENDNTSENKKFLGITPQKIRLPETSYTGYGGRTILVKDVPAYARNLPEMFYRYSPKSWADAKKYQLQVYEKGLNRKRQKQIKTIEPLENLPYNSKAVKTHINMVNQEIQTLDTNSCKCDQTHKCPCEEEINRRVKKELDILCRRLLEYNEETFG
ncbi:2900_t:CDS:2 [Entrophospora sp. SA101]|nr:2900_t:CDS:2 [Entrophospora sp. SA101]